MIVCSVLLAATSRTVFANCLLSLPMPFGKPSSTGLSETNASMYEHNRETITCMIGTYPAL